MLGANSSTPERLSTGPCKPTPMPRSRERPRLIFADRFGQQRWIQTLVRSILRAEPMAQDFGDCFAGVDDESAIALAESIRFGNCVRRQRLAELIASKTGA